MRALRRDRGWTLERAAEATGLDFRHLQQIEAGDINVTLATILRIADGLRVAPSELIPVPPKAGRGVQDTNLEHGKPQTKMVRVIGAAVTPDALRRARAKGRPVDALPNPIPDATTREAAQLQVGRAVASFRRANHLTQSELARRVGVSLKYVQKVEAGKQNLTIASVVRFANALQVEPRHLFEPLYG